MAIKVFGPWNEGYVMDMYVEKYANKFMAHKCNELFTGVMELVAVRE